MKERELLDAQMATAPDTRSLMLDTAERLFAEQGLDRISLREIVRASGQSNLSAAQYHFGSREALIGALLARRIREINEIRHRRLDALEARGQAGDVRALVGLSVGVLCDIVRDKPWGPDYVRVMAQALFTAGEPYHAYLDHETLSGHLRFGVLLRKALASMPTRVFNQRRWWVTNQTVYSTARWIQTYGRVTPKNVRHYNATARNLCDFLAAGMDAPLPGRRGKSASLSSASSLQPGDTHAA